MRESNWLFFVTDSFVIASVFLIMNRPCEPCLMIVGIGNIPWGMYFVEIYSCSEITDLSEFTVKSSYAIPFPKMRVETNKFLLLTNRNPDVVGFFNKGYDLYFGHPEENYVFLHNGDDCIAIVRTSSLEVIDMYGSMSGTWSTANRCGGPLSYAGGWAKRKRCVDPSPVFHADDWVVHENALLNCTSNTNCVNHFPQRNETCFGE